VAEPLVLGEEAFIGRARALAGDGEPFGLVLSGGSARAYAHIGVLEALEEAGVRPDFLVGDSMGALIALLYGAGIAPEDIERLFEAFPAMSLFDLEIPLWGGFIDSASFRALVVALVGELDLSDLPIPVLIICEDLITRRQLRIACGDFATMMSASFVLPGALRPVSWRGFMLVDGGVIGLVPVNAAYKYSARVAVSTTLYDKALDYSNAFVNLNRAIDIAKTRRSVEELLAHRPPLIRCDVEGLSFMQFSRPRELAARGYDSARAVMPDILALSSPRPLPPSLSERRARYRARIDDLIAARERGTLLPLPPDFRVVGQARVADEAEGGFSFLSGLRYAGLGVRFRKGPLSAGLSLLSGLSGEPAEAWGARLDLGAAGGMLAVRGLAASLGASAYLFGSYAGAAGPLPRSLLLTGELGAALSGEKGPLFLPRALLEARESLPGDGPFEWELRGGALLRSRGGENLFGEVGLLYLADSLGNRGPAGVIRGSVSFNRAAALRFRASGRAALEGPGFGASADSGFRGEPLSAQAPLRAYGGLDALWLAEALERDFGELLILQRPELGLYADFDAAGQGPDLAPAARVALGAAATIGLSLFGLTPFDLSFYCGRGLDGSGWSLSLRTGRFFK
jgi:NTE family protein